MPCYTPDPPPYEFTSKKLENIKNLIKEFNRDLSKINDALYNLDQEVIESVDNYYEKKANEATRLLCGVMENLEKISSGVELSEDNKSLLKEVHTWHERHKMWDKSRR